MSRIILLFLLLPAIVLAEIIPPQGEYDPRVRIVDYNSLNVVKLTTFYGVSTHVQFANGETIHDVAVGDDQAWHVVPRGSHLFIKPQAERADTNVTVITDKRTYHFALVVQPRAVQDSTAWADPNLIFSLVFRYPEEEAAKVLAAAKRAALENSKENIEDKLTDATKQGQNFDYWVAGSEEISPTAARDDRRFIYLTFTNNRDMPAVYSVDEHGNEALINTNVIDGNTIVIQRLVRHLMLRKGNAVASVLNKSFDFNTGMDNTTGTISPAVQRTIKGAQP